MNGHYDINALDVVAAIVALLLIVFGWFRAWPPATGLGFAIAGLTLLNQITTKEK